MTTSGDIRAPELPAYELWWTLFLGRLDQVSAALPRTLAGTVQLEVAREGGPPVCYFLELAGPKTFGARGRAARWDTLVETSDEELAALLFSAEAPTTGLRASGDTALLQGLLAALGRVSAPRSLLSIRSEK